MLIAFASSFLSFPGGIGAIVFSGVIAGFNLEVNYFDNHPSISNPTTNQMSWPLESAELFELQLNTLTLYLPMS